MTGTGGPTRYRSLSPKDQYYRNHDAEGNDVSPEEFQAVEELCTCGAHRSPRGPPTMRKPLPFEGRPESDTFRSFGDDERRGAMRRSDMNARHESADYPLTGANSKLDGASTHRSDYLQWELEKRAAQPPPTLRKPLPFTGTTEAKSLHREFSPDEARDAVRKICPLSRGGDFWDGKNGQWVTTQMSDYDRKELEKREAGRAPQMRKPLPFTGETLSRADYQRWDGDARRSQCERAKRVSDDNPLANRNNSDYGTTEYGNMYTPKQGEKRQPSPPPTLRKPLPFTGTTEAKSLHREFSPDEARDAVRKICPLSRGGGFWDGKQGQWVSTQRADYDQKELERRTAGEAPKMRKPLPFNGETLAQADFKPFPGDHRRNQCDSAKFPSTDNPLHGGGAKGDFLSSHKADYVHEECPAGALLREYPPEKRVLEEGRNYMYWNPAKKEWF